MTGRLHREHGRRTTTLGRGGSGLTASIVGAALNVEEVQVWKDVDGMLTCDPRLLEDVYRVRRLSYEEASEPARAGATILHPDTMQPVQRVRMPLVIGNTFSPEGEGTRIECGGCGRTNGGKERGGEEQCQATRSAAG